MGTTSNFPFDPVANPTWNDILTAPVPSFPGQQYSSVLSTQKVDSDGTISPLEVPAKIGSIWSNTVDDFIEIAWPVVADILNGTTGIGDDAIHDNVASEIVTITEKVTVVANDVILIEDSENSFNKRHVKVSTLLSGATSLPTVSRRHTASVNIGVNPTSIPWNTDRIALDATFFANDATDNDIEVAQTGNYLIVTTCTVDSPTGAVDVEGRIHVDDALVTGTIREAFNSEDTNSPTIVSLTAILPLTAGELVGPRWRRFGSDERIPADSAEFSIVFLEVGALIGGGSDTDAIHDNVAGEVAGITLKATPAGADHILLEDSAAANVKKRTTAAAVAASGPPAAHTHVEADITDLDHTDADAIHDNVASEISAVTLKATPAAADHVLIEDSVAANAKKRTTAAAIAASGPPAAHTHVEAEITDLDHTDADAIHDNVAGEVAVITEKLVPDNTDFLLIEDSSAANAKKRIQIGNLPGGASGTDPDAIHDNVGGEISAITLKATPTGADHILLEDSADSDNKKRTTAAAVAASGPPAAHTHVESEITDLDHTDGDAIHDNVASEIAAIAFKATPIGTDHLLIEDIAAANVKKRVSAAGIAASGPPAAHTHTESEITDLDHTDTDAIHDNVDSEISTITLKATPAAADHVLIEDTASANAKRRTTAAAIAASGPPAAHTHTESEITDLDHTDADAIHDNVDGEISAITEKVTPVSGDFLLLEDSAASNAKRRVQVGNLPGGSGTDEDAIHDNVASEISAITLKATPTGADHVLLEDSAAANVKKRTTAAAIAASGPPASHTHVEADITDLDHTDADAIHDNVAGEISAITEKVTPVSGDFLLLEDSAAANVKKRVQVGNLPGGSGTDDDAIHDNVAGEIVAITEKVTPVAADLIVIEDSADSNNKKRVQVGNLPTGSGTDNDAIHDNVASEISAITLKATPTGADHVLLEDSAAANVKKRTTAAAIAASGPPASHTHTESEITDLDHTDADAIHDNVAGEVSVVTEKTEPVAADLILIEDSEDSNNKKRVQLANIPGLGGGVIGGNWVFDNDVTASAPASGEFKYNNAVLANITIVRINKTTQFGIDATNLLADLDTGDITSQQEVVAGARVNTFDVTGTATDQTTYFDVPVTLRFAGASVIRDNRSCDVDFLLSPTGSADAIHDNVDAEISAITLKATPAAGDHVLIEDSAASDAKKRTTAAAIAASGPPASHTHTESEITDLDHIDADAIHDNVASEISAITLKATPAGADHILLEDSADSNNKKRTTAAAIAASGAPAAHTHVEADITDLDHTDADAIHDNVAGEISAITEKVTPVSGDFLLLEDSAAANVKKRVQVGNLPGGSGTDDDAIHDNVANEISAITEKTLIVDGDLLIIEDSEASGVKKRVTVGNLLTGQTTLPALSRSRSTAFSLSQTAASVSTDVERITLDANFFVADSNDIEVQKTGTYLFCATASAKATQSAGFIFDVEVAINGSLVSDLLARGENEADGTDYTNHCSLSLPFQLTAGQSIGPRFSQGDSTNGDILADTLSWSLVALTALALPGSDPSAIHVDTASEISGIANKVTPVGADLLVIEDSAAANAKKNILISALPTGGDGSDTTAVHVDTASEISAITVKGTPIGADFMLIEDSEDSNNKKHILISTLPTGSDADAIHDNVASEISAITLKATPTGADHVLLEDSAAANVKKRTTAAAIAASGPPASHTHVEADITDLDHTDADAIHDNVASEISAVTEKTAPVVGDLLLIEDTEDSNNKKRIQLRNLPNAGGIAGGVWVFDSDVTGSAPASGAFKYDNATPGSVTTIRISDTTEFGVDASNMLAALASSDITGQQELDDGNRLNIFEITGSPVAQTGYHDVPVALDFSGSSAIRNNRSCSIQFEFATSGSIDAIHNNVPAEISIIDLKATPVGADHVLIEDTADSNNKKRTTAAAIAAAGPPAAHTHTESEITDLDHTDADAIHDNVDSEISAITLKATPAGADHVLLEDSAAANVKKRTTAAAIAASGPPASHTHVEADITDLDHTDADAIHDNVSGEIAAITTKATPTGSDLLLIEDDAQVNAKKSVTISSVVGSSPPAAHTHTESEITDLDHTDGDAIHDNVASEISAITLKATPAGADHVLLEDSADSNNKKRTTAAAIAASGPPASHTHVEADITDLDHTDADAIHDNVSGEISAITLKASPTGSDLLVIEDAGQSNSKKRITISSLPTGSDADAIHDNVSGEIVAITEKTAPVGADEFIIEDSAASNAKKSVKLSALVPIIGQFTVSPVAGAHAVRTFAATNVLRYPRNLTITRIRASIPVEILANSLVFQLQQGSDPDNLVDLGSVVTIAASAFSGTTAISDVAYTANNFMTIECTVANATFTGTPSLVELTVSIVIEAELA